MSDIPEKYKNNCPLDHSTVEKFCECDCNYGTAIEVWYFQQQKISQLEAENKLWQKKANYIVEYCKPYLEYMWASAIASTILGCDFYNCKEHLEKLKEGENE